MTNTQIQSLLTYLGYDPGGVDGILGKNTRAAVLAFQTQEGLAVDGSPGPITQAALLDAVAAGRFRAEDAATPDDSTGTWWDEIRYFAREEFRCKCKGNHCGGFPAEPEESLVRIADALRENAGVPITVSSGVRCQTHNASVGGKYNSRHLTGKAMDFCIRGWTSAKTLALVKQQPEVRYAYAIDDNFVHMDVD